MKLTMDQSKKIQVMRGLAIIAVVFIHNTPSGISQVFWRPFLNFSVALFLFFSGMLSSAKKWNPKKRIIKVVIPYILWTLIYTIMNNLKNIADIPTIFIKHLLTGESAAIMYYIFVYCQFTLLIPIIDRIAKSKFKYLGFLIAPIEIFLMRTIPIIVGIELNPYVNTIINLSCLGWFTYYYLGYLIGNKIIKPNIKSKKIIVLWVVSIFFQFCEGFIYHKLGYANCGTQLKITSVITGVLFALMAYNYIINKKNKDFNLLKLLGDNSFGIYFSHIAVMTIMYKLPIYNSFVIFPFTAIITIIITLVCVLIGKKILGKYSWYLAL